MHQETPWASSSEYPAGAARVFCRKGSTASGPNTGAAKAKPWNWQPARFFVEQLFVLDRPRRLITVTLEMVVRQGRLMSVSSRAIWGRLWDVGARAQELRPASGSGPFEASEGPDPGANRGNCPAPTPLDATSVAARTGASQDSARGQSPRQRGAHTSCATGTPAMVIAHKCRIRRRGLGTFEGRRLPVGSVQSRRASFRSRVFNQTKTLRDHTQPYQG